MTALPASLQQAFQRLPPLTGLLWYTNQQEVPCCLIKVPQGVRFSDLSVILDTPREPYQPSRAGHSQERMPFALPFSTQIAPEQPRSNQIHMFHPSSGEEQHLLARLTQASYVLLVGYSSDPVPQYLGDKRLNWAKSKRRTIRQWLISRKPGTLESVPRTKRTEIFAQQAEPARWKLPVGTKRTIATSMMRALITMPEEATEVLPRIYVKVPQGTHFEEVAVAFGPLNLTRYPMGWVLSLSLRLQDAAGHVLLVDSLCDPISERRLLRRLASTPAVEMIALADTSAFPVLGAKRLNWSLQKRNRAQALFKYRRAAMPLGSWKHACAAYLFEHPQGYAFQEPVSDPVGQRDAGSRPVSPADRLRTPHDEDLPPDASLMEVSEISDTTARGAAPADHASHSSSLVEQFVLLHRSGVYEEYRRTHTLSRRIFWRMLLAFALEKTQRKFIWTPEAARFIEEYRQQLAPGTMVPWLSSREHLWIAFAEPIQTPVCAETAALFVFSAADPSLLRELAQQVRMPSHTLKTLERTLYTPEKQRVSLGVVNRAGAIVWAISLRTDTHGQPRDTEAAWSAPAWYTCPSQQCHLHAEGVATLCETCAAARTFVWTWFVAAWQSLVGLYRIKPGEDSFLGRIGEERIGRLTRPMLQPDGSGAMCRVDFEYRYRIVRSIDIADAPIPSETKTNDQRGSWVEVLSSIDPALVFYDEREVPLRTRTLRHPRYAKYIEQHGTNQVEVRPHTRRVPMRADPKAMTQVTAKRYQKDTPKE